LIVTWRVSYTMATATTTAVTMNPSLDGESGRSNASASAAIEDSDEGKDAFDSNSVKWPGPPAVSTSPGDPCK
jgi:hypothetical protein